MGSSKKQNWYRGEKIRIGMHKANNHDTKEQHYFRVYCVPECDIYSLTGSLQGPYKVGTGGRRLEQLSWSPLAPEQLLSHPTPCLQLLRQQY